MDRGHLLLVEANATRRRTLGTLLRDGGYRLTEACDGGDFLQQLAGASFDLILLGLDLPDEDGLVLLRRLRARDDAPVFALSARQDDSRRIAALELGADDYLSSSVLPRELQLRVTNFLARHQRSHSAQQPGMQVCGTWRLLRNERVIHGEHGRKVALTAGETDILTALANSAGRTMSREQLADALSGSIEGSSPETVTVLVYRLRKKLAGLTEQTRAPSPIITVPGLGYRMEVEQAANSSLPGRRNAPGLLTAKVG